MVETQQAICNDLFNLFDEHVLSTAAARKRRREELALKGSIEEIVLEASSADGAAGASGAAGSAAGGGDAEAYGTRLSTDEYAGDTHLRTLKTLLKEVDKRGFERSAQQLEFHEAFMMATARVLFKDDWSLYRPDICNKYGWPADFGGEVMISTPRRFGKTFAVAIYVACLSLSLGLETVIFSPARRASRKILERVVEFIRLVDCGDRIIEYNMEACRIKSFNGKNSLIRSFPSKVGVRTAAVAHVVLHTGEGWVVRDQFQPALVKQEYAALFEHKPHTHMTRSRSLSTVNLL